MNELPYRIAMIVGVPRSGTTFLQVIMSMNAGIATARETHLFDQYIGPFLDHYESEISRLNTYDGINTLIDQEMLLDRLRSIAVCVLSAIHARRRTASIVLEKTPDHLLRLPLIAKCLPGTRFIHVVRDPRGVAASMKAASRHAWGSWADNDAGKLAHRWSAAIEFALQHAPKLENLYRQVRYEDLFVNGGGLVNDLYGWLGLPADENLPADLRTRVPVAMMVETGADRSDPRNEAREGFFRRGEPESWKEELSTPEIAQIEEVCGHQMRQLGYPPIVFRIEPPV